MRMIRAVAWAAGSVTVLAGLAVVAVAEGGPTRWEITEVRGVSIGLYVDLVGALLLAFIGSIGLLVACYSVRNLVGQSRPDRFGRYLLAALISLVVLVLGSSLPVMVLGWTLSGLALAALVAQPGTPNARRAAAHVRRRLLTGDALMWVGTWVAVVQLPTVNRASWADGVEPGAATVAVAALLAMGCVIRSALVPAQSWLPETAEAPSPVSAFLHAGIVNGAGVMGCLAWPLFGQAPIVLLALVLVGAASVLFGTLAARVRRDVKGVLACSTTSQMGYMTIQLGLGLPVAAAVHLIGHGYYKAWMFLRAGGAVSRLRWQPVQAGGGAALLRSPRDWVLPVVIGGLAVAVLWPLASAMVATSGVVAVVPGMVALAAVVTASVATLSNPRTSIVVRAGVPVIATTAAGVYLAVLHGVENLLEPSLPHAETWGVTAGLVLVLALGSAAWATARLARLVAGRPDGWLAVLLTGSALSPWTRRIPGRAGWPGGPDAEEILLKTPDRPTMVEMVRGASSPVAPAWPLRTAVAANPLAGLEPFSFDDACTVSTAVFGTHGYLPQAEYRGLFEGGRITRDHLKIALIQYEVDRGREVPSVMECEWRVDALLDGLEVDVPGESTSEGVVGRFADVGEAGGVGRSDIADAHANLWCQRAWSRALDDTSGPWTRWRAGASRSSYRLSGGPAGIGDWIADAPSDPWDALAWMLARSPLPAEGFGPYLTAVLAGSPGWASHAAWRARMQEDLRPMAELLAVRVAFDLLLIGDRQQVMDTGRPAPPRDDTRPHVPWTAHRVLWQAALEVGYRTPLVTQLSDRAGELGTGSRVGDIEDPDAQLIFCIDVRSERMRRAVEANGRYATLGFAGFFGVAFTYRTARGATFEMCPALIRPSATVGELTTEKTGLTGAAREASGAVSGAPVLPVLVAEAGGMFSGLASLAQTVTPRWWGRIAGAGTPDRWGPAGLTALSSNTRPVPDGVELVSEALTLAEKASLVRGTLEAMGLVDGFAPLLVVVGHGASVENNAFAAAYDCGACGGNSGHINARVLVQMLNDPEVRQELCRGGIDIPDSTVAIAAVHDTTTDDVSLDPWRNQTLHAEAVEDLRASLAGASAKVRAERAVHLPDAASRAGSPARLARHLRTRATDWAQPFPEFGLAGNAAFVIGPRALTAGLDLQGRVFLHDYTADQDPFHTVLEAILTAPAVVTHWINAQYYASTVDHQVFGAGDKATHNVVGDVGVLTGAHGDLRLGLPWQALFTADPRRGHSSGVHEPLRLMIVVHASPDAITPIVLRHPTLHTLIGNEWMTLVAIEPDTGAAHRLDRSLAWTGWGNEQAAELETDLGRHARRRDEV